jgi:hypothetical protein
MLELRSIKFFCARTRAEPDCVVAIRQSGFGRMIAHGVWIHRNNRVDQSNIAPAMRSANESA